MTRVLHCIRSSSNSTIVAHGLPGPLPCEAKAESWAHRAVAAKIGVVFPNQDDRGTHVNVSGAGLLAHAPHPENAVRFLEYLLSPEAQALFATANNEYPVAPGVTADPVLARLGTFKADDLGVHVLGENRARAQKAYDRAGFK